MRSWLSTKWTFEACLRCQCRCERTCCRPRRWVSRARIRKRSPAVGSRLPWAQLQFRHLKGHGPTQPSDRQGLKDIPKDAIWIHMGHNYDFKQLQTISPWWNLRLNLQAYPKNMVDSTIRIIKTDQKWDQRKNTMTRIKKTLIGRPTSSNTVPVPQHSRTKGMSPHASLWLFAAKIKHPQ